MATIALTGHRGFVGGHLRNHLRAGGHEVLCLEGDLAEPIHAFLAIDAVVHCAGVHADASAAELTRNNVTATERVVSYALAARAKTFIYMSSVSVHGEVLIPQSIDETTDCCNPSPYGVSKWLGERIVQESALPRSFTLRPCGIIGPGARRNWLARLFAKAQRGEEIAINNPDAAFNNAVHVGDLCRFIADLIADAQWSGHDIATIAAAGQMSVRDAARTLIEATGGRAGLRELPYSTPHFTVSNERAMTFGYRPMEIGAMLKQFAAENARLLAAPERAA